jgi:hypothetical protein
MVFAKLRVLALFSCLAVVGFIPLGCDSGSGGSNSIGPSPSPSPTDADTMAIFAWNDGSKKMFTQMVNGGQMGNELVYGTWGEHWESMTRYDIDGYPYIMGLQKDVGGHYFIQELLPTGDPGATFEKGWLNGQFDMLKTLTLSEDTVFVIANNANDENHEWAIWEITLGGNLGEKTDSGNWDRPYWTLTSVEFPEATYLFGQSPQDNHWFLQKVNSDGTLGTVTDQGQWQDWYPVAQVVRKNDRTYLFGHTYDPNYWFLQEIYPSGKFGNHTDGGHWHQYYGSTATWETDGKTYLFGHSDSNYRWFIQEILDGGKMAPDHTSYGYWDYFYDFVSPFKFSSFYLDVAYWMTDLYDDYLKDRKLSQISLPGSHDSGMFKHQHCTMGSYCNTVAQEKSIYGQLQAGVRYFDLRPVWMQVQSEWFTGHWDYVSFEGWLIGCAGVNLETALMDVVSFLNDGGERVKNELIILSFSHCYYNALSNGDYKCDDKYFEKLKQFIQYEIGDHLIKGESDTDFVNMTLEDIFALNGKQVLVVMHGASADPKNGIFGTHNLDIYNDYTNTENLTKMENDQIKKLLDPSHHDDELFLLSWTLTLSTHDVENCHTEGISIIDLAELARPKLIPNLDELMRIDQITQTLFPNILYVDAVEPFVGRAGMYVNYYYNYLSP